MKVDDPDAVRLLESVFARVDKDEARLQQVQTVASLSALHTRTFDKALVAGQGTSLLEAHVPVAARRIG